ncbi:hypothetical protein J2I47_24185 [Fibrella sp. HMF5335]|uniref:Uncharacterized protein n=1 Tax=Fibrella rubiginis TaxID=2817060 RepID=A0A939K785_9BACT|nr:hypothetical protein [Fibrella rubiginis]MBO0939668.1 hypothetical protein [Fibrella rubiginis]
MADTDKSLGEKLMGFFIKEDPNAQQSSPPGATPRPGQMPPTPTGPPVSSYSPRTSGATAAGTGSIDTKFVDHFASVLSKANLQGPDYFEFREILRNLSSLGLPEDKQFQAAWASFKAMAGTADPQTLAVAANQYLTALTADRDAFLKSVETAIQDRVGGLQAEQKKLQADNDAIGKQIAELQQRLGKNNERLAQIGGEVTEQSTKINQNRANFEATYTNFTEQIKADVAKIGSYLK